METDYTAYVVKLEELRRVAPDGSEYWMARDLQPLLTYETWRRFAEVVQRAQLACNSADANVRNHFAETGKMVTVGSGAQRRLDDFFLSRYACYLIAMNADPSKPEVGFAQTYFALQTRQQEIHDQLTDQEKRELLRDRVRDANRNLQGVARRAGVARFGIFNDAGYRGLYGGLGLQTIKERKGLKRSDDLLDRAGRAELAANEFRITQTEQKIVRDDVRGEEAAITTHRAVGERVRQTIRDIGGTMPELLHAEPSIRKLATERRKKQKRLIPGLKDDSSKA